MSGVGRRGGSSRPGRRGEFNGGVGIELEDAADKEEDDCVVELLALLLLSPRIAMGLLLELLARLLRSLSWRLEVAALPDGPIPTKLPC